jgi:hypothetical protein
MPRRLRRQPLTSIELDFYLFLALTRLEPLSDFGHTVPKAFGKSGRDKAFHRLCQGWPIDDIVELCEQVRAVRINHFLSVTYEETASFCTFDSRAAP